MKITRVEVFVVSLPLFRTFECSFGALTFEHIMVRLRTSDGIHGWGDSGHLLAPYSGEVVEGAYANAKRLASIMLGRDPFDIGPLHEKMDLMLQGNTQVKCAFDLALYDAAGKAAGKPVSQLLGGAHVERVEAQLDISIGPISQVVADVRRALDFGIKSVGLKVGRPASPSIAHDVETVRTVREEFGPQLEISLDGNGGYSRSEAVEALRKMERFDIVHAEQLVPAWDMEGLAWVARNSSIPIVADEAVWDAPGVLRAARLEAASIIHLKLPKTAGLYRGHHAAVICEATGLPLTVGSMTMGEIGQAALVHFTASQRACLHHRQKLRGGGLFFPEDMTTDMLRFEDGFFHVPTAPGLGLDIDEKKLRKFMLDSWST